MAKTTTWFEARFGKISQVQVVRHTDKSVTIRRKRFLIDSEDEEFEEVRRARISDYHCYYPSWAEAHAHLLARAEGKLREAQLDLQIAQSRFGTVKGMKPPKEPQP